MDDLIDRALKSYASREPSPMLESRILAHAHESRPRRAGWLVAFAAVCLAIAFLPHHRKESHVAQALPPVHDTESQPYAPAVVIQPLHRVRRHRMPEPKLAVFPSPAPIPDAEIALTHALSANPELAASLLEKPALIEPQPITIEPISIKLLNED